jgi:hypothetical protein
MEELEKQEGIQGIDILSTVEDRSAGGGKTRIHSTWRKDRPFAPVVILRQVIRLRPNIVHFNLALAVFGRSRVANFSGFLSVFLAKILGKLSARATCSRVNPEYVRSTTDSFINGARLGCGILV